MGKVLQQCPVVLREQIAAATRGTLCCSASPTRALESNPIPLGTVPSGTESKVEALFPLACVMNSAGSMPDPFYLHISARWLGQ